MKNDYAALSRRNFVKLSSTGLMAMPLYGIENPFQLDLPNKNDEVEVYLFSKHLQFLDYNEMSSVACRKY